MCEQKTALRFRHHFLSNMGVLTVCTRLNHDTRTVEVGWSLFNPMDKHWIRKNGNKIARDRLENNTIRFNLTEDEPILCDYISLKALMLIFVNSKRIVHQEYKDNSPQIIPRQVLIDLQFEMLKIINLLGQRFDLPSILE